MVDYKQITFSEAAIFPRFTRTEQATRIFRSLAVFDDDERRRRRRNSPTESFDGVGGWLMRRSPRGRQSRRPRSLTLFPAARAWFPSSRHRSGTRSALGHLTCHCLLQAVSGSHGGTCCRGGVRRQTVRGFPRRPHWEGGPLRRRAPGHPLARGMHQLKNSENTFSAGDLSG